MILDVVEKIADAVLYEGYLLYPYRRSAIKNQQRFNFGVLYPPKFCEGSEPSGMQTQCLAQGPPNAFLHVRTRFLQLVEHEGRQEGYKREVQTHFMLGAIVASPASRRFDFGEEISGAIDLEAAYLADDLFQITLRISNSANSDGQERDKALLRSLVSVHHILHLEDGRFISLLDPPVEFREAAASCQNQGNWPVLAGEPGECNTMLASPIILYDYPQIAPESPGDLFDGTEIDEILALRILTMTEEEKREVRQGDERARHILERTEMLPPEHFQKLHGAVRTLRRSAGDGE